MNMLVGLMEKGMLPDAVIRRGIRRLLRKRLQDEYHGDMEVERQRQSKFFATLQAAHWRSRRMRQMSNTTSCRRAGLADGWTFWSWDAAGVR